MGIEIGIAQRALGNAVLQRLRDGVFQLLGFRMHLVPAIAEHGVQEEFDQPVVPNYLQGSSAAPGY